jgi:hypothetical protein
MPNTTLLIKGGNPLESFAVPKIDLDKIKAKEKTLQTIAEHKEKFQIPDHVRSFCEMPVGFQQAPRTERSYA